MAKFHQGGCLCGSVRYQVMEPALFSAICCCQSCTKAAGAPSICWTGFDKSGFDVIAGELTVFSSSTGIYRGFCNKCGTTLTYRMDTSEYQVDHAAAEQPQIGDEMYIATATLDEPGQFPPDHPPTFYNERVHWFNLEQ